MNNVDNYNEIKKDVYSFENLSYLQDALTELINDTTIKNKMGYRRIIESKIRLVKKGLQKKGFNVK